MFNYICIWKRNSASIWNCSHSTTLCRCYCRILLSWILIRSHVWRNVSLSSAIFLFVITLLCRTVLFLFRWQRIANLNLRSNKNCGFSFVAELSDKLVMSFTISLYFAFLSFVHVFIKVLFKYGEDGWYCSGTEVLYFMYSWSFIFCVCLISKYW